MAKFDKIIITPLGQDGKPLQSDFRWQCVFQDRAKQYHWLSFDGTQAFTAPKLPTGDREIFDLKIPRNRIHEIEIDTESPFYDGVVQFLKFNSVSQPKGEKNKNLINPRYQVEVQSETFEREFMVMEEKLQTANKLRGMLMKDLRDTAYSIGTNPGNYTKKALLVTLIGPTFEGDAMLKKVRDEKGEEILAVNNIRNKPLERRIMIATIYKAIDFGIINFENGVYMCAGHNMGDTVDKAIAHAQNNDDLYENWIVREVRERDKWDEDLDDLEGKMKVSEYYLEAEDKKKDKKKSTPYVAPDVVNVPPPVAPPPVVSTPPEPMLSEAELAEMGSPNDTIGVSRRNATNMGKNTPPNPVRPK